MIQVRTFETVQFSDKGHSVVLVYALGENGVVYEMSAGRWIALPIEEGTITLAELQAKAQEEAQDEAQKNNGKVLFGRR